MMIKRILLRYLPPFVTNLLHSNKKKVSRVFRRLSPSLVERELAESLRDAGLSVGDVVYVHSSMSKIGMLENGPVTILSSLRSVVGDLGTIGAPCHLDPDLVTEKMAEGCCLDLRTESVHTGSFPRFLKSLAGSHCSSHPFASSCFNGLHAEEITSEHELDSGVCHARSPLGKLIGYRAKIVGIGVDFAAIGFYHTVEDMTDFSRVVYDPPVLVKYTNPRGHLEERFIRRYNKTVSSTRIELPGGRFSRKILLSYLKKNGLITFFKYGSANSWIIDAEQVFSALKELDQMGITIYTSSKEFSSLDSETRKLIF